MRIFRLATLPLFLFLTACPPPESIMTDEELKAAAEKGDQRAIKEIKDRLEASKLPPLPDAPESEAAFRGVLAAGDQEMLKRLSDIGNPWARWYQAEQILRSDSPEAVRKTARDFMIAAVNGNVLEARVFVLLAHQNGGFGYKQDPDYVRAHLDNLKADLKDEIELGGSHYKELLESLPNLPEP